MIQQVIGTKRFKGDFQRYSWMNNEEVKRHIATCIENNIFALPLMMFCASVEGERYNHIYNEDSFCFKYGNGKYVFYRIISPDKLYYKDNVITKEELREVNKEYYGIETYINGLECKNPNCTKYDLKHITDNLIVCLKDLLDTGTLNPYNKSFFDTFTNPDIYEVYTIDLNDYTHTQKVYFSFLEDECLDASEDLTVSYLYRNMLDYVGSTSTYIQPLNVQFEEKYKSFKVLRPNKEVKFVNCNILLKKDLDNLTNAKVHSVRFELSKEYNEVMDTNIFYYCDGLEEFKQILYSDNKPFDVVEIEGFYTEE